MWEESTTYQAILEKGELAGARKLLLKQGRKLFGAPAPLPRGLWKRSLICPV